MVFPIHYLASPVLTGSPAALDVSHRLAYFSVEQLQIAGVMIVTAAETLGHPIAMHGNGADAATQLQQILGDPKVQANWERMQRFWKSTFEPVSSLSGLNATSSHLPSLSGAWSAPLGAVVDIYSLPIGRNGGWGMERLSVLRRHDISYLFQFEGGRCPWIGLVNAYQAVMSGRLIELDLLNAYRFLMEQVGRPLEGHYPILELATLYNVFGGCPIFIRKTTTDAEWKIREALNHNRIVLVFENGGTRVVSGQPEDGNIQWMNFFEPTSGQSTDGDYASIFNNRILKNSALILDPAVVARMIGMDD